VIEHLPHFSFWHPFVMNSPLQSTSATATSTNSKNAIKNAMERVTESVAPLPRIVPLVALLVRLSGQARLDGQPWMWMGRRGWTGSLGCAIDKTTSKMSLSFKNCVPHSVAILPTSISPVDAGSASSHIPGS
jgi:hypothetical protein